jgi:lipid II isoglutaminyl synthase (glutamine-hydrolysing)
VLLAPDNETVIRRTTAVAAAKAAAALSRRFRFGGGSALPGLVAERIDPDLVAELASALGQGSLLVTGTNGKTTTARLLRSIAGAAGLRVVANRTGSNMMRGIGSALVEAADWSGELTLPEKRLGIFEVDEATLPHAARAIQPRAVLFTNLFRDQLDRYGEVEHVAGVWRTAVGGLPESVSVVLNVDDPSVASLTDAAKGRVITYGMKDTSSGVGSVEHAADARWCSACGSELIYSAVCYGHLGHWRCPSCGNSRPEPDIVCGRLDMGSDHLDLMIWMPTGQVKARLPLTGLYNAYNALAAAAAAHALGLEREAIELGLNKFTAAFGRQERMRISGRDVQVLLAKNPAGLNQVLRTITNDGSQANVALFLNDNIADGRDVSWIWDVDFELLAGKTRSVTVSGIRAWDMALRLKYAGLYSDGSTPRVEPEPAQALKAALAATPEGGMLYVIPTYTAMLQVRDLLARWAGRGAFWEDE